MKPAVWKNQGAVQLYIYISGVVLEGEQCLLTSRAVVNGHYAI